MRWPARAPRPARPCSRRVEAGTDCGGWRPRRAAAARGAAPSLARTGAAPPLARSGGGRIRVHFPRAG
eukprot:scaffold9734_cov65-Phaeocystis_antarctica.AAC.1